MTSPTIIEWMSFPDQNWEYPPQADVLRFVAKADMAVSSLPITRVTTGRGLIGGNAGIEGVEILRATDAAQRKPAGGNEVAPAGRIEPGLKIRRRQQFAIDRAAHRGDAADFIDGRTDHREVEPVLAADVAVKHLADMQADIG